MDTKMLYPVLLIPKKCTSQEVTDNTIINLSISISNSEVLYSGFCKIKLLDRYDVDIRETSISSAPDVNDSYFSYPPYSQSQVWIDPDRSPFVFNINVTPESESRYSVYHQTHSSDIAVEQHNTYITQNMYNYPEHIYTPAEEVECEQFKEIQLDNTNPQNSTGEQTNPYEVDEFECEMFISHLFEDIMLGLESDDDTLKQLMSSDTQSMSEQQETNLFLDPDSPIVKTTQKIPVNDPSLGCTGGGELDQEIVVDNKNKPKQKKYRCDKCIQIFDQMAAFKQHMASMHKQSKDPEAPRSKGQVKYKCFECDKSLKNKEKFELHCLGHGDPDRECSKCGKVYASKSTLRRHIKIHDRRHRCDRCTKAFASRDELLVHAAKVHFVFACACEFTADKYEDLVMHKRHCQGPPRSSNDVSCGPTECTNSPLSTFATSTSATTQRPTRSEIRKADSIIAKVNDVFLLHAKKNRSYKKACEVCSKTFVRMGDLKRHLIEHLIRSTLAKNPVNKHGILNIQCEICNEETFNKIDRYKAHLREHAKLTLYQCILCNKSFSDSSNFSKHKKVHGATCFQCDLCQRKFTSKKMITQHMKYHNNNLPIPCLYCNKEYHFESMLNKHIKYAHTKEMNIQFRCKFCRQYFKTLKEKWDHEWNIHNARKMIFDCHICGSKFRKYSDLKRHCNDIHDWVIPRAKKLLNNESSD